MISRIDLQEWENTLLREEAKLRAIEQECSEALEKAQANQQDIEDCLVELERDRGILTDAVYSSNRTQILQTKHKHEATLQGFYRQQARLEEARAEFRKSWHKINELKQTYGYR